MKAIIYCRVSSKEQIEGTSLESQKLACQEYARTKGMTVLKVFVEQGESAKFADRTQLLELIEYCRMHKGEIGTLLVWKVDRFARNVTDHFSIKATLGKYGVAVVSVTEPIDANPEGKLMETILAGFAQFDNDIRAMRSVHGMRRKIQEGIFPWKAPLGYKSPRVGREKKNQPDEPDQPLFGLLQKAWQEFATGTYTKAEIRRLMEMWGITSNHGEPLSNQSTGNLFANKYYAGILVDPWSGDEHAGLHVPMVSPDQFARVQQIISRRNRSIPHQKHRIEFPLRAFARCRQCNSYVTGSFSRGRTNIYPYYHCHNDHCELRAKSIRVPDVDTEFKTFLLAVAPQPKFIEHLEHAIIRLADERRTFAESKRVRIQQTADRLDRELQELIRMRTQQLIGDAEFQTRRAAILEQREIAGTQGTTERTAIDIRDRLRTIKRPLYSLMQTWESLPMSKRPRFQRILLPVGFPIGKVRTAERALILRLEEVFADEDDPDVPLTISRWNQIEQEITELWEVLVGPDNDEGDVFKLVRKKRCKPTPVGIIRTDTL